MLGDTNIMAIAKNTLVTEIEDYSWLDQQSGVKGNFTKAAFSGKILAGVTGAGEIVYTTDGEIWICADTGIEDAAFYDILWDGERFLLAGSAENRGLLVVTDGFSEFTKIELSYKTAYTDLTNKQFKNMMLFKIHFFNAVYTVFGAADSSGGYRMSWKGSDIHSLALDIESINGATTAEMYLKGKAAANSSDCLLSIQYKGGGSSSGYKSEYRAYAIDEAGGTTNIYSRSNNSYAESAVLDVMNLFEVRGELYIQYLISEKNYNLEKYTGLGTTAVMNKQNNFAFVDGVYHNGSLVFFNAHNMLIVKKGESLADKTLGDLIEVTYDGSITCAIKAFDKIFLFGNNGMILASSEEERSNEALAVSTMSARKALYDANRYTDGQIALWNERLEALTARVEVLENKDTFI